MPPYVTQSKVGHATTPGANATLGKIAMSRTSTMPRNVGPSRQQQGNWEHFEVLIMIQCKKMKRLAFKELANPHS